ncbi:MAG: DUF58 domain-containing protein [Deltaproteobacteria bacterium]|nr:DUF58 domain-containing protein [Deltaproteobacteria bacterium]MBK8238072.1 DUF58 domain-containing protein [Deltaproteobacteria bacterium]MBK8718586.1 DUF58 domain-containing protein [Deltaproteobacteria bacterium]MBP7292488.1 DUF58 domain-containing protein [Nannocystaceae bacterium]
MHVDRAALSRFVALRLRAPGAATALQAGDRRSAFRGRGLEFADYRPYDPGDDLRLVDWNVYFRLGTALVRQFHEERSLSVKLCLDVSASMDFGTPRKADHGAQLVATLAMIALAHRDPVVLACVGGRQRGLRARAVNLDGMPELLHLLERAEPDGVGDTHTQLVAHLGQGRADRLVFVSDLLQPDGERDALLRLCAASCPRPIVMHVLGPDELDPDLEDVERVVDAETGEQLVIRDGREAKAAYREHLAQWLAGVEARCRALGIQYVRAETTGTTADLVHGPLFRGQVVEHMAGGA